MTDVTETRPRPAHGTRARYQLGCDAGLGGRACDACRNANAAYRRGRDKPSRESTVPVAVRVPVEVHDEIARRADQSGESMAEVLRAIILRGLTAP